jgi:uncharacterized membrane protein YesL
VILFVATLEQWFWHTWDNLWRLVGWNLVLLAAAVPLLLPSPPLGRAVWLVMVMGPLFTGTIAWAWPMTDDRSPDLRDLLRALRGVWLRAAGLWALAVIAAAFLNLNVLFYLGPSGQEMLGQWPSLMLAGITVWVGALLVIAFLWTNVSLAELRDEGRRSLKDALKLGARILLVHPFLSVAAFLTLVLFEVVMVWTQVGMILIGLAGAAVFLATSVREMYFAAEEKAEAAAKEERGDAKPSSWKEIMRDEQAGGHRGRRPRRSLKEIIKPWEMD